MIAASGLAVVSVALLAGAGPRFEKQEMRVPGSILWTGSGDLDGDKKIDLVVSYRRGAGPGAQRFIAVFFRGDAGFASRPDNAFLAPPNAAVFDVGDAIPGGGEEVVYLGSSGVFAQSFAQRKPAPPVRIVSARTLAGAPEDEDLVRWDFLMGPSRGLPQLLVVPTDGPLEIHHREPMASDKGGPWKLWSRVEIDLLRFYDAERASYRTSRRGGTRGRAYAFSVLTIVPTLDFEDQTGDGRPDLITSFEDRIAVHPQRADGTITSTASFHRWFKLLTPEELESKDADLEVEIRDLDGDGIADLSATKIGGGIMNMKTETRIYRGLIGGGFTEAPVQTFKDDGFAALVRYEDVDGDGKLEMIQPHSEVSVIGITRVLLSAELSIDFRIRRASREGNGEMFDRKPVQAVKSLVGLDFSVGGALRGASPVFGADFDQDGKNDVIRSNGTDQMVLQRGTKEDGKIFEDDGHVTLSAPATRQAVLLPVSAGSKAADVLLVYVDRPELAGQIVLFRATP